MLTPAMPTTAAPTTTPTNGAAGGPQMVAQPAPAPQQAAPAPQQAAPTVPMSLDIDHQVATVPQPAPKKAKKKGGFGGLVDKLKSLADEHPKTTGVLVGAAGALTANSLLNAPKKPAQSAQNGTTVQNGTTRR